MALDEQEQRSSASSMYPIWLEILPEFIFCSLARGALIRLCEAAHGVQASSLSGHILHPVPALCPSHRRCSSVCVLCVLDLQL